MATDVDATDMADADLTKWPDNFSRAWTRAATGWTMQEYIEKKQQILDVTNTRFIAVRLITRDFIQTIKDSLWSADEDQEWVHKLATIMRGTNLSLSELRLTFYTLWVLCIMIENRWKPKSALSRSGTQKGSISETLVNTIEESNVVSNASRELGQLTMVSNHAALDTQSNGNVWDSGFLRIAMSQLNKPKTIPFTAFKPIAADHYSDYINFQHETLLAALRSYHVPIDPTSEYTLVYRSVNDTEFDMLVPGGFHCTLGDWSSRPLPSTGLSPLDISLAPIVRLPEAINSNVEADIIPTSTAQQSAAEEIIEISDSPTERRSGRKRRRKNYGEAGSDNDDEELDHTFQPHLPFPGWWSNQKPQTPSKSRPSGGRY